MASAIMPIMAGVGQIASLLGGSSARTDRARALGAWGQEQNVFNYALPLAKQLNAQGMGTTTSGLATVDSSLGTMAGVKKYFMDIMGGSRPTQLAAMAPEINAINTQADAARNQQAWFGTSRGGGVNAANQAADMNRMSSIDNAIFAARPMAAQGASQTAQAEAGIGLNKANVGLQQLSAGLRALGLSEEVIQHIINSSMSSRMDSQQIRDSVTRQAGQAFAQLASGTSDVIKGSDSSTTARAGRMSR